MRGERGGRRRKRWGERRKAEREGEERGQGKKGGDIKYQYDTYAFQPQLPNHQI